MHVGAVFGRTVLGVPECGAREHHRLTLVFAGKGVVSKLEREKWDKRVRVFFQGRVAWRKNCILYLGFSVNSGGPRDPPPQIAGEGGFKRILGISEPRKFSTTAKRFEFA